MVVGLAAVLACVRLATRGAPERDVAFEPSGAEVAGPAAARVALAESAADGFTAVGEP